MTHTQVDPKEQPKTTLTTEPVHIKNAMLDLCENWESVASEFRERTSKSQTADKKPNPEICRAIAVGLEQCARDVRKVIERIPEHTVLYPLTPPDPDGYCNHNNVAPGSWCHVCGKRMPL